MKADNKLRMKAIKMKADNEKSKMKAIIVLLVAMYIVLANMAAVLALGITPGRTTLDFQGGLEKEIEFSVINNEQKDMSVLFRAEGELARYITLKAESAMVQFSATESEKKFAYVVKLPESLSGGSHDARIVAEELPSSFAAGGVQIGATVSVTSQLLVRVPYPYKYAEIRLAVKESEVNGSTQFYVEVDNLGQHDLVDMQAVIEILSGTNEKLATLRTDSKTIPAGKRGELVASWKAAVNAGQYKAIASLVYDEGKIASAEKVFSVGSLELDVVDISVKNFILGDIAKFDITVQSKWSEVVKDVFAQLQIFDEQKQQIANVKTASLDVPALGRQVLTAFWDTAGIREGTYSGKLLLNYASRIIEKELKTEITLNSIKVEIVGASITARATTETGEGQNFIVILVILVIILVAINIAWFIYFRKRRK